MEIKQIAKTYRPTNAENKLLNCLSSGKEYDTISDLCEDAGTSRIVWYDAVKKPEFVSHLIEVNKTILYASFPAVMNKISKQARRGSYPQQKIILEILKLINSENDYSQINIVIPIMGGKSKNGIIPTDDSDKKDIQLIKEN